MCHSVLKFAQFRSIKICASANKKTATTEQPNPPGPPPCGFYPSTCLRPVKNGKGGFVKVVDQNFPLLFFTFPLFVNVHP